MMKELENADKERIFHTWRHMRQNCSNPNEKDYRTYGGRGIKFCEEWDSSFENFYAWVMANGYKPGAVLQRKDHNGDFTPENCFLTDRGTAGTGIRASSYKVEYDGQIMTNEAFARLVNINSRKTLKLLKKGKTPEQIVAERDPNDRYVCYGHSANSRFLTKETMPDSLRSKTK